jgi:coenzyme F420-reducing hydrogenase beta subunit
MFVVERRKRKGLKNTISQYQFCYGCGACTAICPQKIIELKLNKDGFYQPIIVDEKSCLLCGLCLSVCAYHDKDKKENILPIQSFAAWSLDDNERKLASSGGVGLNLVKTAVRDLRNVCGVRYNVNLRKAEHYISKTEEEVVATAGSKYIQSDASQMLQNIEKGEQYIIVGTPCQIASFRKLMQKKRMAQDVIFMDFFCHGVPSMNMWRKYEEELIGKVGKINSVTWRDKNEGWHESWAMTIEGEKQTFRKSRKAGDLFYSFFLKSHCFNRVCHEDCPYKGTYSMADIRIGDLWGKTYQKNDLGVSGLLIYTERGKSLVEKANLFLEQQPVAIVTEGQQTQRIKRPYFWSMMMFLFRSSLSLKTIFLFNKILRIPDILKLKLLKKSKR